MLGISGATVAARPRATDPRAVGVAFIFVSIGVMVVMLMFSLLFQETWSYALCASIYAIKICIERRFGITSPLSIAILVAYLVFLGMTIIGHDITGYTGVFIFAWLLCVVSSLHVLGKPFTSFYAVGRGFRDVHRAVSKIWVVTYAAALVTSLALMPHYLFVVLPSILCVCGAAMTLFVSFVWCGRKNERQERFNRNGLQFYRIKNSHSDFAQFCEFYARHIMDDPRQDQGTKTLPQLTQNVRDMETALGAASAIILCKENDILAGCIRCVMDSPDIRLPTEKEIDSPFDNLRRHGKLMEIGRLAIDERYRSRSDVINGLFSAFVDLALEHDVSYVVSSGFSYVLPIYLKLGFEILFHKSDRRYAIRRSHGYVTHPLLLDFAELILYRSQSGLKYGMYEMANPYLAERWFKRATVKRFIARKLGKNDLRGLHQIRAVLDENKRISIVG